ncbi:hypothetical protein DSO57_1001281 [Entomophthora muscae]|uniref:Uncharacterized protein n=1 Tax=Entomophthora muscae TaxID=34485 RepID=A0ACC2T8P7_9FUNG|nr:hypothetical protein DSO57_1001281 [Entomophthora muscae]
MPCLQKNLVSPVNESAGLANNLKITRATSGKELKKLSVECGLPEDDKSCGSKEKFEFPHSNPTNERPSGQDTCGVPGHQSHSVSWVIARDQLGGVIIS